jgi:hypothetical protein
VQLLPKRLNHQQKEILSTEINSLETSCRYPCIAEVSKGLSFETRAPYPVIRGDFMKIEHLGVKVSIVVVHSVENWEAEVANKQDSQETE